MLGIFNMCSSIYLCKNCDCDLREIKEVYITLLGGILDIERYSCDGCGCEFYIRNGELVEIKKFI